MSFDTASLGVNSAMSLLERVVAIHEFADSSRTAPTKGALALIDCAITPPVGVIDRFVNSRKPEGDSQVLRTHALKRALPLVQNSKFDSEAAVLALSKMVELVESAQWQIEFSPLQVPSSWPEDDPRFVTDGVIDVNMILRLAYLDVLIAIRTKNRKAFDVAGQRASPQNILDSLSHYPSKKSNHPTVKERVEKAPSDLSRIRRQRILIAAWGTSLLIYVALTAQGLPDTVIGYGASILGGGVTVYHLATEAIGNYQKRHYVSRGASLQAELQAGALLLGVDPRNK
ncbi:MAG: hypothetical protein HY073_03185 [Deltaproteobacteria bacterium]|nr:hypothetical protein [Deltaproteobacteria bacterium]